MVKEAVRLLALVGICAGILTASPKEARAAESYCAGVETTTSYVVKVDAPTTDGPMRCWKKRMAGRR